MSWLLGAELGISGHLVWTAPVSVLVGLGLCFAVVWFGLMRGEQSGFARVAESVCIGLAFIGLWVALAGPVWVEEEGRTEPGRLAVLVDASKSMSVLENGVPRSDAVSELLEKLDGEETDFYSFGSDLTVGRPGQFTRNGTDLGAVLEALSDRVAGERLSGIVIVTDGLDRGHLRKQFRQEGVTGKLELAGPVTVYQVGNPDKINDVSVREVNAGGFAFKLETFKIEAKIRGAGYENKVIPVRLERDGSLIQSKDVLLDAQGDGSVVFSIRPDEVGRFTYEVSVPVYERDAVPSNNRYPVVIRVVRDRIRVLQVAGAPSWDVKMLRRFLKGDPSVDLVSFFILRTNADLDTDYQDNELSLIEFPTDKLFNEELWRFDLVVFQNFDYEPYFGYRADEMLDNVRKYVVEEGNAFVMTGGERAYDLGQYANTPLASILPVTLGVTGEKSDEAPFHPALTSVGARHPITSLTTDPKENAQWWSRLHQSDGANMVGGAAKDAAVLLTHPNRRTADGAPMPVLAVKEAGRGRTMALTVDSSWRWSFSEAAEGRGNQAYLRFWKNAFRWLLAESSASRVVVETPKENYRLNDTVRVVVQARNIRFEPLSNATVQASIQHLDNVQTMEGLTGPDGELVLEVPALIQGPHRVEVTVKNKEAVIGTAETVYAVSTLDPELEEASTDVVFLNAFSEANDAKLVGPGAWEVPQLDPNSGRTVWDRKETRLSHAPGLALLIGLLAGLAWIIRRRSGKR